MNFVDVAPQTTPPLVRGGAKGFQHRRRSQIGAAGLDYYTVAGISS